MLSMEDFVKKHAVLVHDSNMSGGYGSGYDYTTAVAIYGDRVYVDMNRAEKWCKDDFYAMSNKDWRNKWVVK